VTQPRHRLIDPTAVAATAGYATGESRALGMNDLNQVVGVVEITQGMTTTNEAFLWLPAPAYGLAGGFHRLASLPGAPGGDSIARDINDRGQIVGTLGDESSGDAYLWDLSTNPRTFTVIPTGFDDSRAFAINDDLPDARVVGSVSIPLAVPPDPLAPVLQAFEWTAGASSISLLTFTSQNTVAYDVGPADGSSGDRRVAGEARQLPFNCQAICQSASCSPGLYWDAGTGMVLEGAMTSTGDGRTIGEGVNAQDDVVGGTGDDGGGSVQCDIRAAFWSDPDLPPAVLPAAGNVDNGSIAKALSDRFILGDLLYVVGGDTTDDDAVLWIYEDGPGHDPDDPADWSAFDLNETGFVCLWGTWSKLLLAHDLSSSGWICGEGLRSTGIIDTFVLMPALDCPSDIDRSGEVDTEDLLELLAAWGDCPPASVCPEDISGCGSAGLNDHVVNTEDLLRLLGDWGPCSGGTGTIPTDVLDCLERFEPGSLALEQCLWAVLQGQE